MTRPLVVDDRFSCRVRRPTSGVGAAARLDDQSVSSAEPDDVGGLTALGPVSEGLAGPWWLPAIAAHGRDRCRSRLP